MEIYNLLVAPRTRLKIIAISVVLIAFFYVVFRPFQMAHYALNDFLFVNAAYLVLSLLVFSFYLIVFPHYFETKFLNLIATQKGRLQLVILIVFSLGLSFFLFKVSFGYYGFSLERVGTGILAALALAVFPTTLLKVIDRKDSVENEHAKVSIGKKEGEIDVENVLCIYSDKNYVVWVCRTNKSIVEYRVRETLKSVTERLKDNDTIVQTHRAFLVNRSKVKTVKKWSSSYRLTLMQYDEEIPLSRNFYSNFSSLQQR